MAGKDIKQGVRLTGDGSQLKQEMRSVGAEATAMGAKIKASTDQSGSAMLNMANKFKTGAGQQIGALTGVVGSLTAVIGVAAGALKIGTELGKMFETGADRARDFIDALNTTDSAERLKATRKELEAVNAEIARRSAGGLRILGDRWRDDLKDLEDARKALNEQERASAAGVRGKEETERRKKDEEATKKKAEEEKKANADTAKSLKEQLDKTYAASLDGKAKLDEEAAQAMAAIMRQLNSTTNEEQRATLMQIYDAQHAVNMKHLAEFNAERKKADEALHKERLDQIKKETQERISGAKELRDYQNQQQSGFGANDIATSFNQQVIQELQAIKRGVKLG